MQPQGLANAQASQLGCDPITNDRWKVTKYQSTAVSKSEDLSRSRLLKCSKYMEIVELCQDSRGTPHESSMLRSRKTVDDGSSVCMGPRHLERCKTEQKR